MIRTEILIRRLRGQETHREKAELGAMQPWTADPQVCQEPLRAGSSLEQIVPRSFRRNQSRELLDLRLQPPAWETQYIAVVGSRAVAGIWSQKLWGFNHTGCGGHLSISRLGNRPPHHTALSACGHA